MMKYSAIGFEDARHRCQWALPYAETNYNGVPYETFYSWGDQETFPDLHTSETLQVPNNGENDMLIDLPDDFVNFQAAAPLDAALAVNMPKERRIVDKDFSYHKYTYVASGKDLYPTARVVIKIGDIATATNALLDETLDRNLISENLIMKLRPKISEFMSSDMMIHVFGSVAIFSDVATFDRSLQDRFMIVKAIRMKTLQVKREKFVHRIKQPLADPNFHLPKKIDLVLGKLFSEEIIIKKTTISDTPYELIKSKLGFIINADNLIKEDLYLDVNDKFLS